MHYKFSETIDDTFIIRWEDDVTVLRSIFRILTEGGTISRLSMALAWDKFCFDLENKLSWRVPNNEMVEQMLLGHYVIEDPDMTDIDPVIPVMAVRKKLLVPEKIVLKPFSSSGGRTELEPKKKGRNITGIFETRKELEDAILADNSPLKDIAEKFGVTYPLVYTIKKSNHMFVSSGKKGKKQTTGNYETRAELEEAIRSQKGIDPRVIADKVGVSYPTVLKIFPESKEFMKVGRKGKALATGNFKTRDELVRAIMREKGNPRQIAEKVGVSFATVMKIQKDNV